MGGLGELLGGFSGLKGRMLLAAGIVVLSGMSWNVGREFFTSGGVPSAAERSGPALSADWTKGSPVRQSMLFNGDHWGEGAVRIGLSFMAAMVIASFLRVAFKTALTVLVLSVAMLWFLGNRGYIEMWDQYHHTVQEGGNWLSTQIGRIGQSLKEHLPSTSAALVGFGFGLRK